MSKCVMDTFCFYWTNIHSYVLVRVLEQSIAFLPLQSRVALLYFHYAEENITLDNVLNECHSNNWKQCQQCEVMGNRFDQHIILSTPNTSFKLTARCLSEKMMFLNLVKFKQRPKLKVQHDFTDVTSDIILESLQKHNAIHLEQIQYQLERLERAKQCMLDYTNQLNLLDQSLDFLIESALAPITTTDALSKVQRHLKRAMKNFHRHRVRVSKLIEQVSFHNDFLDEARRKCELVKTRVVSHVWYPWSPLLAVLVVVISIVCYFLLL